MIVRLKELLHNIVNADFDIEIKGVTCNPKRVKEGYLFVCVSERSKEHVTCLPNGCVHNCVDVVIQGAKKDVIPMLRHWDPENLIVNKHTRQLYNENWIPVSSTGMTSTPSFAALYHSDPQGIYSEIVSRFY